MADLVSPDDLRMVMRRVPAAVTVVTAAADGVQRGMTLGSFTSVSLDPVLISFNVGKNSSMHDLLAGTSDMAIHLLHADQARYSERFAAPDLSSEEQFDGIPHHLIEHDIPILTETLAYLLCRKVAEYDAGDHSLIVAEVHEIVHQNEGEPLLYYNTHYRAVGEIRDAIEASSPKAPGA